MGEPIAIVGLACRFPGAASAREFWSVLRRGGDTVRPTPADRIASGLAFGGWLDAIDRFDASFFNVSPREADRLDPQQRLLLEVAWHALEDAGIPAASDDLASTGVFVGLWACDYEARLLREGVIGDFHLSLGTGAYSASGRLSHFFGFRGPSMTVDTASSASLVAVHLACRSLREGECALALAGGVNVILDSTTTAAYTRAGMIAADGQCKFGDARADGYVRSEGAGLVVLKRLSRAIDDGDRIYAVIRGSAVNHDGRTSDFLATPGRAGQEQLLRQAFADAAVSPADLHYIEAHGTGSRAGDPIELAALGAVLSEGRPTAARCRVGSVKTNIGHAEAAAGIAGLIKVALALDAGTIPASLHFETPNPDVAWDELPVEVQTAASPWPVATGGVLAGVSAFGIAGTNAHVVLEQWSGEPATAQTPPDSRCGLLPLSSHGPESLAALERDYADSLANGAARLADICYTAGARRSHLTHRSAVVGSDVAALAAGLGEASADHGATTLRGVSDPAPRKIAFVFPGQGSQWVGMGRELYATEPAFRDEFDRIDAAFRAGEHWSIVELLHAEASEPRMAEIDAVQPALFAVEAALAALWQSWGVRPDAVVGHSMGEIAAAYVAGALTAADAARIIGRRSSLLKRVSGRGAMAVVELSMDEARAAVAGHEARVAVAVSNSRRSTVLSGDPDALDVVIAGLEARDVFCRLVKVDVASHSPQMDPLRDDLLDALAGVAPRAAGVPIYSTTAGRPVDGAECDAEYWVRNLRQPVQFSRAIEQLIDAGHVTFVEMSPHPLLTASVQELGAELGAHRLMAVGSLRRGEPERAVLLSQVAQLYVAGHRIDFAVLNGRGRVVSLPPYRWQRDRYWYDDEAAADREKIGRSSSQAPAEDEADGRLREAALAAPAGRAREAVLETWLRSELARILRMPQARIERTRPFRDMGLDSLMGLELRQRLEAATGVTLPVTAIWNHSTVARLATFLGGRLTASDAAGSSPAEPRPAGDDVDALDALIGELEELSDEDAARLMEGDL